MAKDPAEIKPFLCNLQGLLGQSQSDSFTPDITPLMLAAHRDNYEIIKILLERGDRIPKPHNVQCPCKECIAYSNDDILCHSRYDLSPLNRPEWCLGRWALVY